MKESVRNSDLIIMFVLGLLLTVWCFVNTYRSFNKDSEISDLQQVVEQQNIQLDKMQYLISNTNSKDTIIVNVNVKNK